MVSHCPHPVLAAAEVGFQESQGRGPGTWGPAPCLILSSTKEPGLQRAHLGKSELMLEHQFLSHCRLILPSMSAGGKVEECLQV